MEGTRKRASRKETSPDMIDKMSDGRNTDVNFPFDSGIMWIVFWTLLVGLTQVVEVCHAVFHLGHWTMLVTGFSALGKDYFLVNFFMIGAGSAICFRFCIMLNVLHIPKGQSDYLGFRGPLSFVGEERLFDLLEKSKYGDDETDEEPVKMVLPSSDEEKDDAPRVLSMAACEKRLKGGYVKLRKVHTVALLLSMSFYHWHFAEQMRGYWDYLEQIMQIGRPDPVTGDIESFNFWSLDFEMQEDIVCTRAYMLFHLTAFYLEALIFILVVCVFTQGLYR